MIKERGIQTNSARAITTPCRCQVSSSSFSSKAQYVILFPQLYRETTGFIASSSKDG